jgi:hypothetical protein
MKPLLFDAAAALLPLQKKAGSADDECTAV